MDNNKPVFVVNYAAYRNDEEVDSSSHVFSDYGDAKAFAKHALVVFQQNTARLHRTADVRGGSTDTVFARNAYRTTFTCEDGDDTLRCEIRLCGAFLDNARWTYPSLRDYDETLR